METAAAPARRVTPPCGFNSSANFPKDNYPNLTEEEEKLFKLALNNILAWVDELQKVNTDNSKSIKPEAMAE